MPFPTCSQPHDYIPDFIIRLNVESDVLHYLILEIKGYDELKAVKQQAADHWCAAVNADGKYGHWQYAIAFNPGEVKALIDAV